MKNRIALFASLCALFCLIFASADVIGCARSALRLCAELILPSLFPFFVLSILLSKLGLPALLGRLLSPAAARLFGVSGAGVSARFIGLCGGYPMGAAYIAEMYGDGSIGREEAERLLGFCNNSGPAFIVGAVGAGVFGSAAVGLLLYAVHISAAVITGLLLPKKRVSAAAPAPRAKPLPFSAALPQAVRQAVSSVLAVCGFVVCFTVLAGLLDARGYFSLLSGTISAALGTELHFSRALLTGILELGSGVGAMRGLSASPANLALAAGMLGWGGISVQFQTMALLCDTEIKSSLHLAGRTMSAFISAVLAYFSACVFSIFP